MAVSRALVMSVADHIAPSDLNRLPSALDLRPFRPALRSQIDPNARPGWCSELRNLRNTHIDLIFNIDVTGYNKPDTWP
jgi:hypothetical protein